MQHHYTHSSPCCDEPLCHAVPDTHDVPQQRSHSLHTPAPRKLSELRKGERVALTQALTAYELPWAGHEGYKKAEVTGGGVPLTQVELAGLESRVLPGEGAACVTCAYNQGLLGPVVPWCCRLACTIIMCVWGPAAWNMN